MRRRHAAAVCFEASLPPHSSPQVFHRSHVHLLSPQQPNWFPTLLAAAGDTDIKGRLLKGTELGGRSAKVHLDGYNQLPMLTGQGKSARDDFKDYPPSQRSASFSIDQMVDALMKTLDKTAPK
jgi:hypothetical protein